MDTPRRLIVGITGASGSIYGVRMLEMLRDTAIETHLVMSRWGARTLVHETPYSPEQVQRLADVAHPLTDQGAAISSGSFVTMGMVIAPCSARTLAAIAHGLGDHLRSEEHTSELQSLAYLVCRLLLEKKKIR